MFAIINDSNKLSFCVGTSICFTQDVKIIYTKKCNHKFV